MDKPDENKQRKLEYKNLWTMKDWAPISATTLAEAGRWLNRQMPYTEDGTKIRDTETGEEWDWSPPKETIHWGP